MGINASGAEPDSTAMLDVSSTSKGLLMPRMTKAQRMAIVSPANGLMVIQTDGSTGVYIYDTAGVGSWDHILDSTAVHALILSLGDNLGDHVATQNIELGNNYMSNDGDNEGIQIQTDGKVLVNGIYHRDYPTLQYLQFAGNNATGMYADDFITLDASKFLHLDTDATTRLAVTDSGVGVGITGPRVPLHLYGSAGNTEMHIEETNGTATPRSLLELTNNGVPRMHFTNTNNNTTWRIRGSDVFGFSYVGSGNPEMALDTFGRVGIGVIPSAHQLEVNGNVQADSLYIYDGTNAPATGDVLTAFGTDGRTYWTAATNLGLGLPEVLLVDSNADGHQIVNVGKLSIGGTNNQGLQTINGDTLTDLTLRTTDNSNSQGIAFQNSGNAYTWNIYREDAGSNDAHLVFAGGDANTDIAALDERMRITSTGAVGIGTNAPSAEFELVGDAQIGIIRSTTSWAALDLYSTNEDAAFRFSDGSGNLNGGLRWDPSVAANQLFIYNSVGVGFYQDTAGYVSVNTTPSHDHTFYVYRGATALGDYGAGKSTIYGYRGGSATATNGGINYGFSGIDAAIKGWSESGQNYTAGVAGYSGLDNANSAAVIGGRDDATIWGALGYNDGTNLWGSYTTNNAYVGSSLGINESSPGSRLHISATDNTADITLEDTYPFLFLNTTSSNNGGILFQDNGTYDFIAFYNAGLTEFYLDHYSTAGTDFTIASSGYVGLNQPDPTVVLHVDGGSDAALAGSNGYILINDEGSTNMVLDDNEIIARNNGAETTLHLQNEGGGVSIHNAQGSNTQVIIEDDGDVGIGESAPQTSLDVHDMAVVGNISVGSESTDQAASNKASDGFIATPWLYTTAIEAENERGANSVSIILSNDGNYGGNDEIHFITNGNDRMVIESNGEVGIGVGVNTNAMLTIADDGGDLNSGLQLSTSAGDDWYMYQNGADELVFRDDGSDRVKVNANGHFTPASDNLYDLGISTFRWDDVFATNAFIQTSDIRFKKNVHNLSYGLKEVMTLRPVHYEWKDDPDEEHKIGFVAQEVIDIIPEVVNVGDDSLQTLGMRYGDMIPVLVSAIQEQQAQIEALSETNEEMQQRMDELNRLLEEYMKSNGTDPEELKASTKNTAEGQ